jgi:hypothetical protein
MTNARPALLRVMHGRERDPNSLSVLNNAVAGWLAINLIF